MNNIIIWVAVIIVAAIAIVTGTYLIEHFNTKKQNEKKARLAASAGAVMECPMPCKVLQVKVNAGDTVEKGQDIFVVDACKMEIEIPSNTSGMIKEIITPAGSTVEKDEIMVLFY